MEIILHAHHAEVTESLREHAEAAIHRIAARVHRVANAIVRFIGDGTTRRVEIVLQGTRTRPLFAHHRLESQVARVRSQRLRRQAPPGEKSG
jgi:ribosome-associated translation inhibitor RaiA